MIVDNAEDLIEHEGNKFKALIAQFLNECESLSIVLTSRIPLGKLEETMQGKIQLVHALKDQPAVELFYDRTTSESITAEEVY